MPGGSARDIVAQRAAMACERCGALITGRGSIHHRRPRRMGGSRRPDTNQPQNLLLLCGSGTTGCHGWIESHRALGYVTGMILYARDDPAEHPYQDARGAWWRLDPDGNRHPAQPPGTHPR